MILNVILFVFVFFHISIIIITFAPENIHFYEKI